MSITEMEYNSDKKSLQVVMKLFIDDAETVLEKENDVRLFLGTEKEHSNTNQFLQKYLFTHFIIEQSKGSLELNFVGKEVDKDYVWVYFEIPKFKIKDETLLSNTMLLDYFPEQINKMNYIKGKEEVSFSLFKNNISKEF